jgi:4-hydroxy-tetrahydrodipicolinate reductase
MDNTRLAINGAAGRMGLRLVALGTFDPDLEVVAALEHSGHAQLGKDVGPMAGADEIFVNLSDKLTVEADAVIDFSVPQAAANIIDVCIERGVPLVMATTGLEAETKKRLEAAAEKIAVCWAPNMSLAVNLTMKLAAIAGKALRDVPSGADVEIVERHHRFKEDAPSGTALWFGETIAEVMGQTTHVHGREGRPGQRPQTEIGYHALRVGDNPGEHTIVFGLLGETVELRVAATNRDAYAAGALAAAKFIARQEPGMYDIADVLGL